MTPEERALLNQYLQSPVEGEEDEEETLEMSEEERALLNQFLTPTESTAAPTAEPEPTPEEERPGLLRRSLDRLQLGLSDAMSTMAGDSYGRSGDPTQRDDLSFSGLPQEQAFRNLFQGENITDVNPLEGSRVTQALGSDLFPAAAEVAGDVVGTITPEPVKEGLSSALEWMKANKEKGFYRDVDIGGEIVRQAEALGGPEAGQTAREIGTMGATLLPQTRAAQIGPLRALDEMGETARPRLRAAREGVRESDIRDRWRPENQADAPGRVTTTANPFAKNPYEPTPREAQMYQDINDVVDLDPRAPYIENFTKLDDTADELRQKLDRDLRMESNLPTEDVINPVREAVGELDRSTTLVGDARQIAENIYEEFERRLAKIDLDGEVSPAQLMQIRRDLDNYVLGSKKQWDPTIVNAQNEALSKVRTAINKAISESTENANVKESLRKQSSLLTARDEIRRRANREPLTGLGRTIGRIETEYGIAQPRSPLALIANITNWPSVALGIGATAQDVLGRGVRNAARTGRAGGEIAASTAYRMGRGPLTAEVIRQQIEEEERQNRVPFRGAQ